MIHIRADQFILNRPFEASADSANRLVDVATAPAVVDHSPPDGLQCQGAKIIGIRPPVQLPDDLEGFLDATVFAGDLPVLPVIPLGEFPVRVDNLDHGGFDLVPQSPTVGQEFGDQAVVFSLAGRGVPLSQVDILAVDRDNGLPCGLVATVRKGREKRVISAWGATSISPNPVVYRIS